MLAKMDCGRWMENRCAVQTRCVAPALAGDLSGYLSRQTYDSATEDGIEKTVTISR